MVPGPSDARALFNLFLLYDPSSGIQGLIDRLDLGEFDRRRIYEVVLGRVPESAGMAHTPEGFDPRVQLVQALLSQEFRQNLIKLIFRAFPHHHRVTFLHLPKCAGTDLIRKINHRYPTVNNTISNEHWVDSATLFNTLKILVAELHCSQTIFVHGHIRLAWLMRHELIRSRDEAFTVLRNPFEMTLSQVNYIVTRITSAAAATAPDALEWLKALELSEPPLTSSPKEQVRLAKRILANPRLVHSNVMCTFLAQTQGGSKASADSAIANLVIANLEITDTSRYDAWAAQRFGETKATRHNRSRPVLTEENISNDERDHIMSITSEDQILFDAVTARLSATASLSVRGNSLA